MKTFDRATKIIEEVNKSPFIKGELPYDGVNQEFIAEDIKDSCVEFGRHILQAVNRSVRKGHFNRVSALSEEQGEELLKDMFESWNEDKTIKLKDDTIS